MTCDDYDHAQSVCLARKCLRQVSSNALCCSVSSYRLDSRYYRVSCTKLFVESVGTYRAESLAFFPKMTASQMHLCFQHVLQETELVREGSSSCALCAVSTALFSALSGSCARTAKGSHNCQAVYDVRIGWVLPALIDR